MKAVTMNKSAQVNTRIEPTLKQEAESVLHQIGLKPSEAISMFYRQLVMQRGLPFDAKIPNQETIEAMQDVVNGKTESFDSLDDLIASVNK